MGVFDWFKTNNNNVEMKGNNVSNDVNDERYSTRDEIFKAYYPKFLYKPPYGYPRNLNVPLIKEFGKFSYINTVINLLQEEASGNEWNIVPRSKEDKIEQDDNLKAKKDKIIQFLNNPNGNKESFGDIIKQIVRDICEVDSGVIVKVFSNGGELKQIFARDGGSFLKNPDIYGYLGNRDDFVFPDRIQEVQSMTEQERMKYYDLKYKERAAYFQYGWAIANMPVPYGKREIIYFSKSPRSDDVYGVSPVQVLADILLTLVYGSQYNLDFYMNNNMPEGVLQLIGADATQCKATQKRLSNVSRMKDKVTGFMRKVGFKIPVVNVETKFTPFQMPAKDLQIIEQQQWFTKQVWSAFGLSAEDLGYNENSNKATSQTQAKRFARKAVRPFLNLIEERINMELMPEFDPECQLKFTYDDYDLDNDIKKHQLYEAQLRMGIKTPEMIAEEENIDISELQNQKEEEQDQFNKEKPEEENTEEEEDKEDKNENKKSKDFDDTELEKYLVKEIKRNAKKIKERLDKQGVGKLERIQ